MGYPERPHSAIPPLPVATEESDGNGCQACIDGVPHVSCEPYFEEGEDDLTDYEEL